MSGKPAARQSDPTSCPLPGHGTNPIATGSPDVLFDNLPAARMTDTSACGSPIVGAVASTVFINGLPAATLGSTGGHGSVVVGGSGTVIIGDSVVTAPFTAASGVSATASPSIPTVAIRGVQVPAMGMASHFVQPSTPMSPRAPAVPLVDRLHAAERLIDDFDCRATPTRVFNDRDYPLGSVGDPFEKQHILEQLRVRIARAHGRSINSRLSLPSYPDQDRTSVLLRTADGQTRSICSLHS